MNPVRWIALRLAGYAYKAQGGPTGLTFIANWLAGVLWTIDTTWQSLVKETYGKNAVVYTCVRLLSQSVPEGRLTAYMGEGEDRKELESTHELRLLLKQPNELMTRFEADELTTIQIAVVGRSVWWKERSNGGQVIALWPLRPDRVGPVYSVSSTPGERVIAGYAYQPPEGSTPIVIPRADCIAFNFPDPDGESGGIVEGLGPLSAASRQIAADNKATDHVGALLANYAQPGVALKMKQRIANQETADLIKAKFRQEFGGARLGMPAILDGETELQTLGFTLADLEFPELRANAEARICGALGVPPILAGVKVGLDRSTFANMKEAREFFAETTLSWYWRRYADQYTNDLASEFGEDITCEYDTSEVRALAGQKIEKLTPIKEAFTVGVATRNEYRRVLGLDPLEPGLGDILLVPSNVTEVPTTDEAKRAVDERKQEAVERQQEMVAALPQGQAQLPPGQEAAEGEIAEEEEAPLWGSAKSASLDTLKQGHGGTHAGHGGAHAQGVVGKKRKVDGIEMDAGTAKLWADMPEGIRRGAAKSGLKEVRLVNEAAMSTQVGALAAAQGTVGVYTDAGILVISKSSPDPKETMLHELAHVYDPVGVDGKFQVSEGKEWMQAAGWKATKGGKFKVTRTIYNQPVSEYGSRSPWEDFATSLSKFVGGTSFDRRVMQGESEGRYAFLQKFTREQFGMEIKATALAGVA